MLISDRLPTDVVAVGIIVALWASGLLEPDQALAGFGSEPAVVVAAVFVLSAGMSQTGVSAALGRWISRAAGTGQTRMSAVLMPAVALLSAFTHHLTTTAVMLPITLDLARERGVAPSRLLMPLSFAASLGTAITIIGAPAFLIASDALRQAGQPGLTIFSITPIGLAITAVGTVFILTAGRFLLPERSGTTDTSEQYRLDDYFTEVTVLPGSPLIEQAPTALEEDGLHMRVVGWVRDGQRVGTRDPRASLQAGDVLLVRTSPESLIAVQDERGIELQPIIQYHEDGTNASHGTDEDPRSELVQAVLSPRSRLVGRTLGDVDFRRRYGAVVISLWRQDGWLGLELARTVLRAGDVLVLRGTPDALARVAADRDFLLLLPFQGERRIRRKAPIAVISMLGVVIAAAIGVPLEIAGLAGALVLVVTRCLTPGEAYQSIDQRVYVFIAGAIPLGEAMQRSGASDLVAGWLEHGLRGVPLVVVLLVLFAVVAVVTQFLSDAATTALFAPVGVALASGLGHSPTAYVVTVAMAAVTAFLTPLGHHGNLVIYAPGGYRFADFPRVGVPLTAAVAVTVALLAPLVWPT